MIQHSTISSSLKLFFKMVLLILYLLLFLKMFYDIARIKQIIYLG